MVQCQLIQLVCLLVMLINRVLRLYKNNGVFGLTTLGNVKNIAP